jgi:Fe-S oxidoreductase
MALPLKPAFVPLWTTAFMVLKFGGSDSGGRPSGVADKVLHNEELCSKCGSCIAVCPAYIDTQDERTTARGKLQLGKALLNGGTLSAEEANVLFLCMHCGACTDVCQSRLDLVPVWDELEQRVQQQYGKDTERVERFVKSVEAKKIMGVPYARGAEILVRNKPE